MLRAIQIAMKHTHKAQRTTLVYIRTCSHYKNHLRQ